MALAKIVQVGRRTDATLAIVEDIAPNRSSTLIAVCGSLMPGEQRAHLDLERNV